MSMIPLQSKYVFVDESGNPSLGTRKEGASDYYVVSAVIVSSDRLPQVEDSAWPIIRRFFPKGELKSSSVGGNRSRRLEILRAISELDFRHYSQVVDKTQVFSDSGLRFKKSFVKFIHRSIYRRLFEAYSDLHIVADEYGRTEFMQEFRRYLVGRMPPRLFENLDFRFKDSASHPLIQVADFIAGTIARVYSGKDTRDVLAPLHARTIIIDEWPPKSPVPPAGQAIDEAERLDMLIRLHAVDQAQRFIDENTRSTAIYAQAQVAAVRYLLYHFRSVDPEEYVLTNELHQHLEELGFPMSERILRGQVIGRLRDHSVFIASSKKGIKIPYCIDDLRSFVRRVSTQVVPYLRRLQVLRDHFMLATDGGLDIVGEAEYPNLSRLLKEH